MIDYIFIFLVVSTSLFIVSLFTPHKKAPYDPVVLTSTEQCTIYKVTDDEFKSIYFSPNCAIYDK